MLAEYEKQTNFLKEKETIRICRSVLHIIFIDDTLYRKEEKNSTFKTKVLRLYPNNEVCLSTAILQPSEASV